MKATVHVDGGPLNGTYTFENYAPQNLNHTGLDQGSNEFFAWLLVDGAFSFARGNVGYVQSGMTPADMRRRLAGEKSFQAEGCNYELTEYEKNGDAIVCRYNYLPRQR